MTSTREINKIIDEIVNTPLYGLIGVSSNRLVYVSTEEGYNALWSSKLDGEDRIRLFDKPFYSYARVSWSDKKILFTIDATKGFENHIIISSDIVTGESYPALDMNPLRITGIAVHDNVIVFTSPSKDYIKLFRGEIGGRPDIIKKIRHYMYVVDFNGRYVILEGRSDINPNNRMIFIYDILKDEFIDIPHPRDTALENGKIYMDYILYLVRTKSKPLIEILNLSKMKIEGVIYPEEREPLKVTDILNFGWGNNSEIWISIKFEGRCILKVNRKTIPTIPGYISNATIYDYVVYYNHSSIINPTSIWKYDLKTGENLKILGVDTPNILRSKIKKVRFVKYPSVDNVEVPAFIIENSSKNRNILIYLHGGPWREIADKWSMIISVLIASGYNLFLPNYRGSRGYGTEFEKRLIGDPGGIDIEDIIYGYKYLIEHGYPSKMGLMGFSYGGFLAFLASGKYPDYWKCVIVGSGVCNWRKIYENADYSFKRFIDSLFGGNIDLFEERSPDKYFKNIKSVLCIVHPENDARAPLKPVLECIGKLKRYGVNYEIHIIRDAGHVINSDEKFRAKMTPILKFLDKYLSN